MYLDDGLLKKSQKFIKDFSVPKALTKSVCHTTSKVEPKSEFSDRTPFVKASQDNKFKLYVCAIQCDIRFCKHRLDDKCLDNKQ